MKRTMITLFLVALIHCCAVGHGRPGRIDLARTQLNLELSSRGIDTSKVYGDIIDVDSSIGVMKVELGGIRDPYGTLQSSFVFAIHIKDDTTYEVWPDSNSTVGVMKDGRILWMSERLPGGVGGRIAATLDLNKDSTVDIVSEWDVGSRDGQMMLWIHSWDGTQGRTINATDSTGTALVGLAFNIADLNGDGIMEIVAPIGGYDETEEAIVEEKIATYTWNGSLYGEWPGGMQVGN